MEVLWTVDLLLRLVQKLQHFPDNGLQRTAQVFPTVRLPQRGHMNKCRAAMAEVQRCVVGEVTQIPAKDQSAHTPSHLQLGHQTILHEQFKLTKASL